ncbi:hypothetical protein [Micromonospora sp. NPDC005173]|uniref:hypothetical protein n=1 Tax=Micromonospora sp. NPDC005173 TaxID=3157165 RepID=UPI0033B1272B
MSLDIDHIYVPIKFDLGGTLQDVEPAIPLLATLGATTLDVVEHEETRAYKISYLATHPPPGAATRPRYVGGARRPDHLGH